MGLIKAALGSVGGILADQWREYYYCDSMDADVLMTKGVKRTGKRSSNTKASDNIISNGAVIAVNEGQAMMIVEQGKIVEFTAEAGEFTWDASTEGTIFYGGLGKGLSESWENLKRRFTFGGDTARDQRIYFINTKEILGNKYGTPAPVPFRVVDPNIGLDLEASLRCNGEYSEMASATRYGMRSSLKSLASAEKLCEIAASSAPYGSVAEKAMKSYSNFVFSGAQILWVSFG